MHCYALWGVLCIWCGFNDLIWCVCIWLLIHNWLIDSWLIHDWLIDWLIDWIMQHLNAYVHSNICIYMYVHTYICWCFYWFFPHKGLLSVLCPQRFFTKKNERRRKKKNTETWEVLMQVQMQEVHGGEQQAEVRSVRPLLPHNASSSVSSFLFCVYIQIDLPGNSCLLRLNGAKSWIDSC